MYWHFKVLNNVFIIVYNIFLFLNPFRPFVFGYSTTPGRIMDASESKTAANPGDESETRTVHLVSQEGESFDVPISVARISELVKTMIDDEQDDEEAQEIPLPNVKSPILAKVIEFAQHYTGEPMTEIEKVSCADCIGQHFCDKTE